MVDLRQIRLNRRLCSAVLLSTTLLAASLASSQTLPYASTARIEEGRSAANEGNFGIARILWEREADAGYAEAEFLLGRMYARGDGVRRDYARAREYFQSASQKGHGPASVKLARMYYHGDGLTKDLRRARELAQAHGGQEARELLALIDGQRDSQVPRAVEKESKFISSSEEKRDGRVSIASDQGGTPIQESYEPQKASDEGILPPTGADIALKKYATDSGSSEAEQAVLRIRSIIRRFDSLSRRTDVLTPDEAEQYEQRLRSNIEAAIVSPWWNCTEEKYAELKDWERRTDEEFIDLLKKMVRNENERGASRAHLESQYEFLFRVCKDQEEKHRVVEEFIGQHEKFYNRFKERYSKISGVDDAAKLYWESRCLQCEASWICFGLPRVTGVWVPASSEGL